MKYLKLFESKKSFDEISTQYIDDVILNAVETGLIFRKTKVMRLPLAINGKFFNLYTGKPTVIDKDDALYSIDDHMIKLHFNISVPSKNISISRQYAEDTIRQIFYRVYSGYNCNISLEMYLCNVRKLGNGLSKITLGSSHLYACEIIISRT